VAVSIEVTRGEKRDIEILGDYWDRQMITERELRFIRRWKDDVLPVRTLEPTQSPRIAVSQ